MLTLCRRKTYVTLEEFTSPRSCFNPVGHRFAELTDTQIEQLCHGESSYDHLGGSASLNEGGTKKKKKKRERERALACILVALVLRKISLVYYCLIHFVLRNTLPRKCVCVDVQEYQLIHIPEPRQHPLSFDIL